MAVTLRGLSTAVPATVLVQDEVRDVFAAQPGLGRLGQRIVATSFNVSGIERRHSVLDELRWDAHPEDPVFFDNESGELLLPGTKVRNELYAEHATRLYVEAGRAAIEATPGIEASDVTHVITVSCTGFYAPGPDFMIARDLGLNPGVERYHLGFMGCYASIPALRIATQLAKADASAVVLVVSVELCTLHLRSSNDPDTIVASSLFADGAGSGIVTARPTEPGEKAFDLDRFATRITPVGEGDMAWKIGDHGFEMVLSNAIPAIIDDHITGALEPLFEHDDALAAALAGDGSSEAIEHWAIHPGGRSILDKVETRLGLTEAQLVPARDTLRDYGNMSSATVLFVLRNILHSDAAADGDRVAAMAFGPGLTVESALLTVRV
ncbi:type III polyketide synthase [Agromyces fucosus]|uniref:Type III polyketide synthase n=1 Tax=Agromyces fucosus TaxID=41985 RepID=A0A4Q2JMU4_9MICO|nr:MULTISPECIES: type III polyketide synthase [Agromyces]KQZ11540.1 naringenin-chalcone synthase [Agromyces sp. Root1464]RXZ49521.1 type III polyketide synthase [Agromyces fucosus]